MSLDHVRDYLRRSAAAAESAAADADFASTVAACADSVTRAMRAGGRLLIAGNGGSAADAQHLAAEFLSRFTRERRPLPALALTTDTSVLTAVGNDYGFEHVFDRQVRGLGSPRDVLLAISTSGRSPNILSAVKAAREIGLTVIGFTGSAGGTLAEHCDLCLRAPSVETAIVQQLHMMAGHAICGIVEAALAADAS